MDGDGFVDALSTAVATDEVAWYHNDGTGVFTHEILDDDLDGAYGVFTTDIDLDGDVDILSAGRDSFEVVLYTQTRLQQATVEFNGMLIIDGTLLQTVDPDDGPEELTYTLTDAPAYGELRRDGGGADAGRDVHPGRCGWAARHVRAHGRQQLCGSVCVHGRRRR
ncbi:MAG: hypothetical protein R2854_27635 [Caldilineaceae bacterium]